jgi:hypothetical protein
MLKYMGMKMSGTEQLLNPAGHHMSGGSSGVGARISIANFETGS